MKIIIENIGSIKEAKIDLSKKLIVLCGPNNTGKTYIAYCIYAINRLTTDSIYNNFVFEELKEFFEKGSIRLDLYDIYLSYKENIKKNLETAFLKELPKTFGIDKDNLQKIFPKANIKIEFDSDNIIKELISKDEQKYRIGFGKDAMIDFAKKENSLILDILLSTQNGFSEKPAGLLINSVVMSNVLKIMLNNLLHSSYIAPVERNSIYTFSKELSLQRNVLVDKILELKNDRNKVFNPFDLLERRATRYPIPVRDGLEIAEDIVNFQKRISEYFFFAEYLEQKVLDGKVLISKDGEIQFQPNKAKKIKLPIHLTASIVKSFSSLIIYFKHIARKGDLIIIDEPELNLHPDAQILVARIIAKIINHGFNVVINTHSDYIIRELNNLIMLGNINNDFEQISKEYSYSSNEKLNSSDIAAYLFTFNSNRKNKVNVKELEISSEGFETSTIDEVINDLNLRSQNLFFSVRNNNND